MAHARWLCCFTPWLMLVTSQAAEPDHNLPTETQISHMKRVPPPELARFFQPPEQYRSDFGTFRSPLLFADGTQVKTPADWQRRREEIRFPPSGRKIVGTGSCVPRMMAE